MKKLIATCATAALLLCLTSCGDGDVLSSSSAKKALKKEAVFAKDFAVKDFNTGFYEITESELEQLQQLKAAGVVEFTTEKIIEKAERREYNYWYGYSYYTVDVEHTFANVSLTEEGKKYVVENPTTQREDKIKDFKGNEDFEEELPPYVKSAPASEADTIVAEDVAEVVAVDDTEVVDSVAVDSVVVVAEEVPAPAPKNTDPNAAYKAALDKVKVESHKMLLGRFELIKVKEVLCTEEMAKNGKGKCLVLFTFKDKTPFGFVLGAPKQGYIMSSEVSFIHYQDLGWTVSDMEK